jgi:hypothetical protein
MYVLSFFCDTIESRDHRHVARLRPRSAYAAKTLKGFIGCPSLPTTGAGVGDPGALRINPSSPPGLYDSATSMDTLGAVTVALAFDGWFHAATVLSILFGAKGEPLPRRISFRSASLSIADTVSAEDCWDPGLPGETS